MITLPHAVAQAIVAGAVLLIVVDWITRHMSIIDIALAIVATAIIALMVFGPDLVGILLAHAMSHDSDEPPEDSGKK